MIKTLLLALGLVLVFEGILPFIAPSKWRRTILMLGSQNNDFVRKLGLVLMICGALIVILVHNLL